MRYLRPESRQPLLWMATLAVIIAVGTGTWLVRLQVAAYAATVASMILMIIQILPAVLRGSGAAELPSGPREPHPCGHERHGCTEDLRIEVTDKQDIQYAQGRRIRIKLQRLIRITLNRRE
jgi:hypothetical protein